MVRDEARRIERESGCLGATRLLMAVEDHGGGAQYVRLRCWPRIGGRGVALALALAGLGALAARDGALAAAALLGASGLGLVLRAGHECMAATGAILRAAAQVEEPAGGRQRPSDPALLWRLAAEARPWAAQLAGLEAPTWRTARASGGFAQVAAR